LSGTHWQLTWHHLFISGITSKGGTAEHTALALSGEVVVAVMVGTEVVVVAAATEDGKVLAVADRRLRRTDTRLWS